MDLLYILGMFFIGFVVFTLIFFVLARLMFPKLRAKDDEVHYSIKKSIQARSSKKNPYSF